MLFGNNNLVWKLNLRYVGLLVELSIASSNACCCCFYYFDSFCKHCFSLKLDLFLQTKGVLCHQR